MSVLAVATPATRPAPRRRHASRLHAVPRAEPLTVTISIDGGSPAGRERVLAALRDLVSAAGPDISLTPDAPPAPEAALVVNPYSRTVLRDGVPLELSRLEYDLLLFLARNPGHVFTRSQLLAQVWGHTHTTNRTVDVHVSRLRTKLQDQDPVTTVYGIGYRLADSATIAIMDR